MNIIMEWALMITAVAALAYIFIRGRDISRKTFYVLCTLAMLIFFVVEVYGIIRVQNYMDIMINAAMWIMILGLSFRYAVSRDIKRLAAVLYIPCFVFVIRLIDNIIN